MKKLALSVIFSLFVVIGSIAAVSSGLNLPDGKKKCKGQKKECSSEKKDCSKKEKKACCESKKKEGSGDAEKKTEGAQ